MMIFTRIDIIWIGEIILGLRTIEEMITIVTEMSIGVMTVMIQDRTKISRTIIVVMVGIIMTAIIHLKAIMEANKNNVTRMIDFLECSFF